ncbi:S-adenosyl-L-methionine-dependent methyltransferase [Colletotrichum acutatum]|uniref:S-adenosyl-L-methionine-dependent methyltransferase n=1 Tax=Glomerella acutata TaxID=27357 RepID=A0AAD8XFU2_GLOAC|nr:S-adenosyl-L-methionine-dependent methyltransferase [Colletotrichum acutatum]KAK1726224.1 S-adenosyl-L-methionine-dependent methyltransferase [Colletotrichum acutatum]
MYPGTDGKAQSPDLQHNVFLLTFGNRLGLAPPCQKGAEVPGRVLDVGTGTGIWAIDFGDEHPEAEVLGIDLSPNQPTFLPPNVDFEVDDIEEEWVFDEPFDYIHSRLMTSSIADWKEPQVQIFLHSRNSNLTPGGYLELQEVDVGPSCDDGTLDPTTSALARYCALLHDASVMLGRPYQEIPKLADLMRDPEVGFVDVEVRVFKWPTNGWPAADTEEGRRLKELGVWSGENIVAGLQGFAMAPFTRAFGWSKEDVDTFLVGVRNEMRDESIHAYGLVYSIVGRKPLQ